MRRNGIRHFGLDYFSCVSDLGLLLKSLIGVVFPVGAAILFLIAQQPAVFMAYLEKAAAAFRNRHHAA